MRSILESIKDKFFNEKILPRAVIFLIILFSLLLAIYNSAPFESVDEDLIGKWIWGFHDNPFPVNQYPPLFLYLHFFLSLIYKSVFLLLGIVKTGGEFIHSGIGYEFMKAAGRYVSAVSGMVMVWFIYRTGKDSYNTSIGIASSLFVAFNGLFILHAHIFKSDIIVSCLITVSIYFLLKFMDVPSIKSLFFSSFFFGLAFSAKYNIVIFFLILLLGLLMKIKETGFLKGAAIIVSGVFSGFILTAPNWITNPVGNLKKLVEVYNFEKGDVYIQDLSPVQIYVNFLSDIREQFGIVLLLILISGILISFLKRDKKSILLSLFLITYIIFFGLTGFYGRRFLLPLFPAIVFLIGKTIFIDFLDILKIPGKLKRVLISIIFIPIVFFSLESSIVVLKKFNMVSLESKFRSASKFRKDHNLNKNRYVIGSQSMTPKGKGDKRFYRNFKVMPYSRRKKRPEIIQVNGNAYDTLEKIIPDPGPGFIDLVNFRIFHRIEREDIQDWDKNIYFMYRFPESLKEIDAGNSRMKFPVIYTQETSTAFFPSQKYEKSPGFCKSESGSIRFQVYSEEKVERFLFSIHSLNPLPLMKVIINGKEAILSKPNKNEFFHSFSRGDLKDKPFRFGSVYSIEIFPVKKTGGGKFPEYYILCEPEFFNREDGVEPPFPELEIDGGIPDLFSGRPYPDWIREIYKLSAIDLVLYDSLIQLHPLDRCPTGTEPEFVFPLSTGDYILKLDTEPYAGDKAMKKYSVTARLHIFTAEEPSTQEVVFEEMSDGIVKLKIEKGPVFVRVNFPGLRKTGMIIRDFSVKPDIMKLFGDKRINR